MPQDRFQAGLRDPEGDIREKGASLNTISFSCPKVYWSIDTHLNTYWQRYYGQNFDLFLTTQKSWTGKLHRMGVENTAWLPWYGAV